MKKKHTCTKDCKHDHDTPFLSIHNHSIYSNRDCLNQIDDIYKKAADNNFEVVITDHGNMGAIVDAYQTTKKYNKKFIAGCEFYVASDRKRFFETKDRLAYLKSITSSINVDQKANYDAELRDLNFEFDASSKYGHIVAIAKNLNGYHQMMDIHNKAFTNYFYKKPLTDYKDYFSLPKNKKGERDIILTSACLANQINQYIIKDELSKADQFVEMIHEEYGSDFYIEVQANDMDIQKKCNIELIKLARKHGIKMCIANDAHYTHLDDGLAHQILLLLQGGNTISDKDKMVWQVTYETNKGETRRKKVEESEDFFGININNLSVGDFIYKKEKVIPEEIKLKFPKRKVVYEKEIKKIDKVSKAWIIEADNLTFCTEDELKEKVTRHDELKDLIDELFSTNREILKKIEDYFLNQDSKLPKFENDSETLKKIVSKSLIQKGLHKKPEYVERLKYELNIINESGFASYFLILEDVFKFVQKERMPKGPGRGSSSSSLVSYLLDITMLDPIEFNFPFERFLNLERTGLDLVTLVLENGRKFNLLQSQDISVIRNGQEVVVKANELQETDEIVADSLPKM